MISSSKDSLITYLSQTHKEVKEITKLSLAVDNGELAAQANAATEDLSNWLQLIHGRFESKYLATAFREYHSGMIASIQGFYRQGFMTTRLFIELSLGTLLRSTREFDYRLWIRGQKDTSWAAIVDDENGLLSPKFTKAFCPASGESIKYYNGMARAVYRECSEFVHGNPGATAMTPDSLSFSEELFRKWNSVAKTAMLVVHFSTLIRYSSLLTRENLISSGLEDTIRDELGHEQFVREIIDTTN